MGVFLAQLHSDIYHTLLRIAEFACFCYMLSSVPRRRAKSRAYTWLVPICFVLLAVLLRAAVYTNEVYITRREFIYINYLYYPLVFAFVLLRCKIDAKAAFYYLLLIFQGVHIPRLFFSRLDLAAQRAGILAELPNLRFAIRLGLYIFVLLAEFYFIRKKMLAQTSGCFDWKRLAVMVLAVIPVFYIANIGIFTVMDQSSMNFSTILIGYLCSICGMVVIISYNNSFILAQKEQELIRMEAMLHSQHQQYQLKKETAEIINQKYHDLKNHLLYLNVEGDKEKRTEYIRNLEAEISAYDALCQTGSETLDVILSSKGVECSQRGIQLLLLLDGQNLSFLKPVDVAAIFGNAMDNAMEALESLEECDRELIIRMSHSENWLSLHFENPYAGELLREEGGGFRSTKVDGAEHGIGLRSIAHIVSKYGGNMTAEAREGRFVLNILFPRQAIETL